LIDNKQNINLLKSDTSDLSNSNLSTNILKNDAIIDNNDIEVSIKNTDLSIKKSSKNNTDVTHNKLNQDISPNENAIDIKNNVNTENNSQTFGGSGKNQSNLVAHECNLIINVDDEEGILKMHKMLFKR